MPDFNTMKAVHNLPDLPIDINEYADKAEQNPANSVYYIAQLERHNMRGLRANWGSKGDLHDFLANLVFKKDGTYHPNGEWQLYKYYAQMGGERFVTTVKIIAGTRTIHAPYEVKISGLKSLGLPAEGSVKVNVLRFDWAGEAGLVDGPVEVGQQEFKYTSDTVRAIACLESGAQLC
jgi:hypothetical protein